MIDVKALLARNLNGQGELYHFQGQYIEAKQYYEQALFHYETFHKTHCYTSLRVDDCAACSANVASVKSNIAKLYHDMGDYNEAQARYKKVEEVIESIPEDRVTTSTANIFVGVLSNLGELYHYKWSNFSIAEQYYSKAMNVCTQRQEEQSLVMRSIRAHQAKLHLDRSGSKEAKAQTEVRYLDVVRAYEAAYEEGVPDASMQLAIWLNNLALIYYLHNEPREAQQRYEEAEKLYNNMGWTSHFSYAVFLTNYAQFLQNHKQNHKKIEKAHFLYKSAESIYRNKCGEFYQNYQVADFLYDYAHYFLDARAKNYDAAMPLLEKAIDIYSYQKPCLGHDKVINALKDYRKYYPQSAGRETPETLYNRMITKYRQLGGQDNPQIARIERMYTSQ